ncbi:MAG: hypothetical protein R8G33_01370 [Gammaproteobacteria bacterium]|nr:hypothetical protein [Gammaproteobacteria bacterium]
MTIVIPARADGWFYQTSMSTNLEADDNKRLRSENEKGVVGANAKVDIKLSNVTEISEVYVRGALRSVRYDGDDDRAADTDDQLLYAGGRWDGERSQLSVDGEFLRQSSQFTELTDTGFLEDANRRVDKSLSSQYSYIVREDTQIFVGGSYTEVDFPNSIPVSLTEYSVEGLNAGVQHNFDALNYVTLNIFSSDYEADNSSDNEVNTIGSNIRYNTSFTELWQGYAQLGYRKSNFKNQISGSIVRNDDTGVSYDFGATRNDEVSRFNVDFSNSLEPSADGDVNERTEVNFTYNRQFSSRISSRVGLKWFEDESINNNQEEEREYWQLSLGADYRLTPKWYVTSQVRHRDTKTDNDINSTSAESDAVIIGIRFQGQENRI